MINFDCHFPKKTDVLRGSVVAACEDGSVSEFVVDFMSSNTPVTPHCTVQFVEEKQVPGGSGWDVCIYMLTSLIL